jgi:DNA polymerase III alpha subunit
VKTELNDRVLWFDGTNQVSPDMVPYLFLMGVPEEKIVSMSLDEDLKLFNQLSENEIQTDKTSNTPFNFDWNIPIEYKNLNLSNYLNQRMVERGVETEAYANRLKLELVEIQDRNLENLFKTLIFVVDKLKSANQVWGVGRGSSCASLVLYLIGVHEVDPIKYGIPLQEFFHD